MIKLSIIFPVYNVEKYIRPSLESIYKQGLDEDSFEVIIINDGTKDKSMEMIADIVSQHNNIKVIEQENQGLSVARNKGISIAKGEYIIMPDSDDMLVEKSIPYLLQQALSSRADLVVADFIIVQDDSVNKTPQNICQDEVTTIEKTGERLFLEDLNPYQCYVWRTLFRRKFLLDNNIKFVPGIFYQDVPFTHECYLRAKSCLRTNWLLNIYRKRRPGSATYSFSLKKARDFCITIAKTWELTRLEGLSRDIIKKIQNDVYTSFSVMVWCTSHAAKKASERVKIIDFLKEKAPDLEFTNNTKQIITTFMYKWMPHTLIHYRYLYDITIKDGLIPFYRHKIMPILD